MKAEINNETMSDNLTKQERHEEMRKKLWFDVFLSLVTTSLSIESTANDANLALDAFDEKFPKENPYKN